MQENNFLKEEKAIMAKIDRLTTAQKEKLAVALCEIVDLVPHVMSACKAVDDVLSIHQTPSQQI